MAQKRHPVRRLVNLLKRTVRKLGALLLGTGGADPTESTGQAIGTTERRRHATRGSDRDPLFAKSVDRVAGMLDRPGPGELDLSGRDQNATRPNRLGFPAQQPAGMQRGQAQMPARVPEVSQFARRGTDRQRTEAALSAAANGGAYGDLYPTPSTTRSKSLDLAAVRVMSAAWAKHPQLLEEFVPTSRQTASEQLATALAQPDKAELIREGIAEHQASLTDDPMALAKFDGDIAALGRADPAFAELTPEVSLDLSNERVAGLQQSALGDGWDGLGDDVAPGPEMAPGPKLGMSSAHSSRSAEGPALDISGPSFGL